MDTDALLDLILAEDQGGLVAALSEFDEGRLRVHYRVPLPDGDLRHLLVVGHVVIDSHGTERVEGHIVNITADLLVAGEEASHVAVRAAVEGRGLIDQAKGSIMLAYGLTDDQAFALLRWWSRNRNVRIKLLAERLMAAVATGGHAHEGLRAAFDRVMHDLTIAPDRP